MASSEEMLMDDIDWESGRLTPLHRYLDFTGSTDLEDSCTYGDILTLSSHEQGSPAAAVEPTEIDDNGNGTVHSEAAPELTKRKRKSRAWNSFVIDKGDDGTQSAKCKHCNKKYKYSSKTGTSNLLQHLKKCSATDRRNGCGDKPADETGGPQATRVLNGEEPVIEEEWSNKSMAGMLINQAYNKSIAGMLINQVYPLSMLKPQSHECLKTDLLRIYREDKEKLRRSLNIKSSSSLFNITINFWEPVTGIRYCCLTLHFIDDAYELKKKVLNFKKVLGQSKNGWKTVETLKDMLQEWTIVKNVCSVVVQNTDKTASMVNKIKNWLDYEQDHSLPSSRKLFHINCFVNVLNHLFANGLEAVSCRYLEMMKCLESARDKAPENEANFRKAVDQARSKGEKVTSEDMPIGSPLSFRTLEIILGLRGVFVELQSIDSDYRNYAITEEEWNEATCIFECLKVLDEAVRSLSASTCLTTNMYFFKICKIYLNLQCLWERFPKSDVKQMADKMTQKLKKFWDDSIESLATAAILDPRFNCDTVEHWCKKIDGQNAGGGRIYDTLAKIYNKYAAGIFYPYEMLDLLEIPCTSSGEDKSQKSELERYLKQPKFPRVKEFDILGWWRVNTPNFPILARMARDFLAIPISAAQSNPSFNDEVLEIHRALDDQDSEFMEAFISTRYWSLENARIDATSSRSKE